MAKWLKLSYVPVLLAILIWISLVLTSSFNPIRAIAVGLIVLLWLLMAIKIGDIYRSSILLLFIVLPLNITFTIPSSILSYDPFVKGLYVNYLVPVITIQDLSAILVSSTYLLYYRHLGISSLAKYSLTILFLYILFQFFQFNDYLNVIYLIRIGLYGFTVYTLYRWFKSEARIISNREYNGLVYLLAGLVVTQVFISFSQFMSGSSIGLSAFGESVIRAGAINSSFMDVAGNLFLRGYGTFPHPNVLSGFYLLILVIMLFIYRQRLANRTLVLAVMMFTTLGIALTFSRIALLLAVIFWCIEIANIFLEKRKNFQNLLGAGFIWPFFSEKILNFNETNSYLERIELNKAAVEIIKDNPWTGFGAGRFIRALETYAPINNAGVSILQPVHNLPLLIAAEHGVLIAVALLFVFIVNVIFSLRRTNSDRITVLFILTVLISVGMVDHYLLTLPQGIMLLALYVLLAKIASLQLVYSNKS